MTLTDPTYPGSNYDEVTRIEEQANNFLNDIDNLKSEVIAFFNLKARNLYYVTRYAEEEIDLAIDNIFIDEITSSKRKLEGDYD